MRYLLITDIPATFRRGKAVEQFMGRSPAGESYVRYIELRPSNGAIEIWIYDVEDIVGDEENYDLYNFPYLDPDGPEDPVAIFEDSQAAIAYSNTLLSADPTRWVNSGVAQSEYLDYVLAGRPSKWPPLSTDRV